MRNGLLTSAILTLILFGASTLHAQTPAGLQGGDGQAIPDLSGIWEAPVNVTPDGRQRVDLCGEAACGNLLKKEGMPTPPHDVTIVEPQMLPWAEEKYQVARGGLPEEVPVGRDEANPWFSACTPLSPSALLLSFFISVELRQFPDVVLLLFAGTSGEGDHLVRRIYLDGRGHPANLKPTWMGHSIGHYDGDTLVVDTIGIQSINRNRMVDLQGHRHSDALHLVERFRRAGGTMEYEVTITDPSAYKNSWIKKIARQRAVPGPRFWDQNECEELMQMGTHYGMKAK